MIGWILSKILPPRPAKLGKVDVSASLLLEAIHSGVIKAEEHAPREAGTGLIHEWGEGRAKKPTRVWRAERIFN